MSRFTVLDFYETDESKNRSDFVPEEDWPDGTFEKSPEEKKAEEEMFNDGYFYAELLKEE